jgi:hypothetical protein
LIEGGTALSLWREKGERKERESREREEKFSWIDSSIRIVPGVLRFSHLSLLLIIETASQLNFASIGKSAHL